MSRIDIAIDCAKELGDWADHLMAKRVDSSSLRGKDAGIPGAAPGTNYLSLQLRSFNALVIVDREIDFTVVGGSFTPTTDIDLMTQNVLLTVGKLRSLLKAGSLTTTGLDGYMGRAASGKLTTDFLLQRGGRGIWEYRACVKNFVPGHTPVTVSLSIGRQAGRATTKPFVF